RRRARARRRGDLAELAASRAHRRTDRRLRRDQRTKPARGAPPDLVEAAHDPRLDDGHARGLRGRLRPGQERPSEAGGRLGVPARRGAGRARADGSRAAVRQDRPTHPVDTHRSPVVGLMVSAALVAAVTGVIFALRDHVSVLSLSVLYLLAVIPVAALSGLVYALLVSVASMLAFNFFFLAPVHSFTLQDSSNWFALGIFVFTSVVVSELAARSRRTATESAPAAGVAGS